MHPSVAELCVQDVTMAMVPPSGVAADLGNLEKPSKVTGYAIDLSKPAIDQLAECFTGADLLMVPAGAPRKPGMTRDDLFNINAGIAKGIVEAAEFSFVGCKFESVWLQPPIFWTREENFNFNADVQLSSSVSMAPAASSASLTSVKGSDL